MSPSTTRRGLAASLAAAALSAATLSCAPGGTPARVGGPATAPADLVLTGGPVLTLDPARPAARAIAVRDGLVLKTGSEAEVASLVGPRTEVVRLRERAVVPGFVDAHACLACSAWPAHRVLEVDPTKARLLERLGREAAVRPELPLVLHGWVPAHLLGTREELDAVAPPGRPVLVFGLDGDAAWLDSAAIAWLKLEDETDRIPKAGAPRGADGRYRGIFLGAAWTGLIHDRALRASAEGAVVAALDSELGRLAAAGVTCVHDWLSSEALARALVKKAAEGTLPLRVRAWTPAGDDALPALLRAQPPRPDLLRHAGSSVALDGSPASGTAANRIARAGPVQRDEMARRQLLADAQQKGARLAFDAYGSLAVKAALDAVEGTSPLPWAMRVRIEHADVVEATDAERPKSLNVVLSVQPGRAGAVARGALDRALVPAMELWGLASHVRRGTVVALGSAGSATPLETIAAAMRGPSPKEALTFEEALAAHTRGGAYAGLEEDQLGTLETGRRADLVVLSADPRGVTADRVETLGVERTVLGGRTTWPRGGTKAAGGPR